MKSYAHQKIPTQGLASRFTDKERLARGGRGQPRGFRFGHRFSKMAVRACGRPSCRNYAGCTSARPRPARRSSPSSKLLCRGGGTKRRGPKLMAAPHPLPQVLVARTRFPIRLHGFRSHLSSQSAD